MGLPRVDIPFGTLSASSMSSIIGVVLSRVGLSSAECHDFVNVNKAKDADYKTHDAYDCSNEASAYHNRFQLDN